MTADMDWAVANAFAIRQPAILGLIEAEVGRRMKAAAPKFVVRKVRAKNTTFTSRRMAQAAAERDKYRPGVLDLRDQGLTIHQIANRIGKSYSFVKRLQQEARA